MSGGGPLPFSGSRREDGFTLIELLVVILILGILTSIVLPSLIDQRGKGQDAGAKALVRTAQVALQTYAIEQGTYEATPADVTRIAPEMSQAPGWTVRTEPAGFLVMVDSRSGRRFEAEQAADGSLVRRCAPAGGGCPSDGFW
ncbi:MAG TPA: type II secretion system protein [Solirubrobacteraceae bacterium]|nr:type II secretion system protein [Solirubrobacteraceae bacterium]